MISVDLFLWPMLVPMIIPLVYCVKYKKESLREIGVITLVMGSIVVLYWPLLTSNYLSSYTYIVVKTLLFIVLPVLALVVFARDPSLVNVSDFGVKRKGLLKSLKFCIIFLPIMFVVTAFIQYLSGVHFSADILSGIISFFESFTEEFFFRGILFLYLVQRTNLPVAYCVSVLCFVLMHPQHFTSLFLAGTIIQGILTVEISRRSGNMIGSWFLHGANRVFNLAIIPLFF